MLGVERIGQYNVTKMGDNKYAVALNNGNLGAFVTDKAGVEELRQKYNRATDTVEFSTKEDDSKPVKENKKGGNWGKAIASTFLTGLGQLFDGRTKDGLVDMATDVGLYATAGGLSMAFMNAFAKATQTGAKLGLGGKAAYIGAALAGFGLLANKIHTIVDAYKGGK